MFTEKSITYKIVPGVQIVGDTFEAGYVIEQLDTAGRIINQRFNSKTKTTIIEDLKRAHGYKTKGQLVIEAMLGKSEEGDV